MYKCSRCGWPIEQRTRLAGWMTCPVCDHEYPASYSYSYADVQEALDRSLSIFEVTTLCLSALSLVATLYAWYQTTQIKPRLDEFTDPSLEDLPACLA